MQVPYQICCCCCLVAELCLTLLRPCGQQPTRLLCLWDFPGKNTGVGCYLLLQGIFLTQDLNPHLLHWQANSLLLSLGSLLNTQESTNYKSIQERLRKAQWCLGWISNNDTRCICTLTAASREFNNFDYQPGTGWITVSGHLTCGSTNTASVLTYLVSTLTTHLRSTIIPTATKLCLPEPA